MKRSILKAYEIVHGTVITQMTIMYQLNKDHYDLTILFDDFGKEICRDNDKHETRKEAMRSVLGHAYEVIQNKWIEIQKDVNRALGEPKPSLEEYKGMFRNTPEADELRQMMEQVENVQE